MRNILQSIVMLVTATLCLALPSTAASARHAFSQVSLSQPDLLKVSPLVDVASRKIIFPVVPGTSLTNLAPTFDSPSGLTISPKSGSTVNLSNPVQYNVSSGSGKPSSWTFSAVEMGSPALPGLYADPNIVVFGNTYYIYSTTDGFPGWDLVTWKRTPEPVLTLNGTSGNVPWADGNAWAPTIAKRSGKYYLYFSGNNPTYNQKAIGVAVASSPTGPFKAQPTAMITNTGSITTNQAIDPAYFLDPKTGTHYLFWGNGHALMAELADDMISLKNGTTVAVERLENFTEASFIVYRQSLYHYTYSYGDTDDKNYMVNYATATNITGPWTSHGTVLHQRDGQHIYATGSSSTVNVPGTDDWYMAYHRFHVPDGNGTEREICLDKISWKKNGIMDNVTPTLGGVPTPVS